MRTLTAAMSKALTPIRGGRHTTFSDVAWSVGGVCLMRLLSATLVLGMAYITQELTRW